MNGVIPWYLWCALGASTTVQIGVQWDIAWHRSIGRDTFWSPPHMAIYLAAVLAAVASASQILSATFRASSPARAYSVRVLWFRGPLGAFITAWGGLTMLASAPFDDWWHNAYGLDVKILSPPHVVLAVGILAIHLGAAIFVLGKRNSADGELRRRLTILFLYVQAMILLAVMTLFMEKTVRVFMHRAPFYALLSALTPVVLCTSGRATGHRWAATITALLYSAFLLALLWIFPLFPAEPKLGPVTVAVTQLIPPEFPLLFLVPALVLDLLWSRTPQWSRTRQAAASGIVFAATFFVAQWPFATFLMSEAARNHLFGAKYFDYNTPLSSFYFRYLFLPHDPSLLAFAGAAARVSLLGIISAWAGLACGDWMRRIRR
ncbi:MAG: hypothetical protein QOI66_4204 [Myxococcales bacterium]|jgi:hypothetical protein|nr:hypothetical protein [Myxococcales bacterium]